MLLSLPDWLFTILVVAACLIVGVGGLLLTRRYVARLHGDAGDNDVVSYYLNTIAVFYGIMMGLIAVGAWQSFHDAGTATALEAGALAALYRDVSGLPEPMRGALQADLREYARYEIDVAWELHRRGLISRGGAERLWRFQDKLQQFQPHNDAERALLVEVYRAYNDLILRRSLRLDGVTAHLPRPLWNFVFVGAVLICAVSWFFRPKSFTMHLWMTVFFAGLIGLEIQLMLIMDHPYRGSIGVSPEAFQTVYDKLMR